MTYYQFYSNEDTIRINSSGKVDYLGHKNTAEQVKDAHGDAGFFPYNSPSESGSNSLNYGHGVKIEIPFLMTPDGKLNGKDIIFEFSGDDDVWVFIDGNLALDIGGSHGEIKGSINFADLSSTVDKVKDNTYAFKTHSTTSISPSNIFNKYKTLFSTQLKQSLSDTTKIHTLTFFYMERGMDVSNLKLNFNLPEPTKLTVSNTVKTDNVNKTFADDTAAVAKKDVFIYDIADKTLNKAASMEINNGESILFANEFHTNDTLIVQESKLKNDSRSLSELYATNWILKDTATEIAKESNSLVVDDNRTTTDKTLKFSNKDNTNSPVLTAAYTNVPKVGTFAINTDLTEEYKTTNEKYKEDTFNYTVTYKNVFGGDSAEVPYKGEYLVINEAGDSVTKTTTDGVVSATADETIKIVNIPVKTVLNVTTTLTGNKKLSKVATTSNFTLNNDKTSATGTINKLCNEILCTVTDTTETVAPEKEVIATPEDPENDPEKDLHTLNKGSSDMTKDTDSKTTKDALDDSPSTADSTDLHMWIILLAISVCLCMGSLVSITKKG
jgi:fibro-slime domain-containing protein